MKQDFSGEALSKQNTEAQLPGLLKTRIEDQGSSEKNNTIKSWSAKCVI